jgi:hypothetical protein
LIRQAGSGSYVSNGYRYRYVAWDAEVVAQLVPTASAPLPTSLQFLQEVRLENESGEGVDWRWGAGELFRPAAQAGGEYLVLCGGCPAGTIRHVCRSGVYAIDGVTHALAERALEFPAGTMVASVMNPATIDPRLGGATDGGTEAMPDATSDPD